jgi:hypothetical protein
MRKPEALSQIVPDGHSVLLFLDSDTVVLDNIDFGFEQAAKHGLAISIASNYSLPDYYNTGAVMLKEGFKAAGQSLYNSGVIFYRTSPDVLALLKEWHALALRNNGALLGDQEALTIAMLATDLNPYVLSKSFNVRGLLEVLSGAAFIWHGKAPVPEGINLLSVGNSRRILVRGRLRPLTETFLGGGALALAVQKATDRLYRTYRKVARLLGWSSG